MINWMRFPVITVCDAERFPDLTEQERKAFLNYHNKLRKEVAQGKAENYMGKLPSASNMYKLKYDCNMEKELKTELDKCNGRITFTNGYGQNNAKYSNAAFLGIQKIDQLKVALESWHNPVRYYGIRNSDNIYDDGRLYTFANFQNPLLQMVYSKTTRFGCAYVRCDNVAYISCIYNLIGAYPNNVLFESGTQCKGHEDCKTYSASTCEEATGLCKYTGPVPIPGGGTNTMCRGNDAMTDEARNYVLDVHNSKRSLLARGEITNGKNSHYKLPTSSFMPRMIYDCTTEAEAIKYARTCSFTKSPEKERKGYGENVFTFPTPNTDPVPAFEAATECWWTQIFAARINDDMKFVRKFNEKAIDQRGFTQMAWARSVKLGCALQTCSQSSFVVCRYSPAGNIVNEQIYVPGRVCEGCLAACIDYEGLCNFS
ncbi:SCP-like protein [Necator americanus]|uniref:SCP-like protein n=1 Tax=Necator americanus TaxID=51031 RepID=W2TSR9_NECAM|nr:SCP-like protein [Necator americanus]ETN84166.1 SCP-like protein [Necator americanus]